MGRIGSGEARELIELSLEWREAVIVWMKGCYPRLIGRSQGNWAPLFFRETLVFRYMEAGFSA